MEPTIDPNLAKHAAGPLGALSALFFLKGPLLWRLGMLVPGAALSYYASGSLAAYANMPEGLAGYLIGLFGMAAVGKVFETWETLQLGDLVKKRLEQWLGLKKGGEQ